MSNALVFLLGCVSLHALAKFAALHLMKKCDKKPDQNAVA